MDIFNLNATSAETIKINKYIKRPDLFEAAKAYNSLQERSINPSGNFDKAGRFFLHTKCPHCACIRSPSRAYPYSQMTHGRSAAHVAFQYNLAQEESDVKAYARLMKKYPILATSQDIVLLCQTKTTPRQSGAS